MLISLENNINNQFHTQEVNMIKRDYQYVNEHINEHNSFNIAFILIKEQYFTKGPDIDLAEMIGRKVKNWYLKHIKTQDSKYESFLNTLKKSA